MSSKGDSPEGTRGPVPPRGTGNWKGWGVLLVFGVAVAIRLVHVATTTGVPTIRYLIGDAAGYYEWAQRIAAGDWLGTRAFYQAPLYPYALAVWQLLGYESQAAARVLQVLWGGIACALLCVAATKLFSPRVGIVAGFMLALYPPAIYFDGIIQKASLDCLLVCAMLACIAFAIDRVSFLRAMILGAVVSLLCLTRENAIAWHLVLIAWMTWWCTSQARSYGHETSVARYLVGYLLGAGLVLLPIGMRNAYVQGEFLLTTSQAGPNFFIGNNAGANGRYQPLVRGHETPTFEQTDATMLAEQAEGRSLTPREVSRYWMRRAWGDIAAGPLRWIKLSGYKLLLVWNRYEIADAESIAIHRRYSPLLLVLGSVLNFGVLAALAALGVALTWSMRRLAVLYVLVVTMTLAVAAFYVLGRYRYPLVPMLVPFAAAGIVELWNRRHQLRTVMKPIIGAVVVAIVVNWPIQNEARLDALAEMNAGVALAQAGEITEASAYFARAVQGHPTSPEANYNLGLSLAVQGKFAAAVPYYHAAIAIQPELVGAHFNLAVALEQLGQSKAALKHFEIAAEQDPADAGAQAAIRRLSP